MRILDCFTFFNEVDLLRLRMAELQNVVDAFVLVEASHSHSGRTKPVYSEYAMGSPTSSTARLITHVADLSSIAGTDRWQREHAQRDDLMRVLADLDCDPDDVILLSDADEIPRAAAMPSVVEMVRRRGVAVLEQTLHRFYLNNVTEAEDHRCGWCGTIAIRYRDLLRSSPSECRRRWCAGGQLSRFGSCKQRRVFVRNGGWHFTYMGGMEAVVYKRQNFAHAEGDDPDRPRVLRYPLDGTDGPASQVSCSVYGGACPCGCTWGDLPQAYADADGVSLAEMNLPEYLTSHPEAFVHWMRSATEVPVRQELRTEGLADVMVLRDTGAVEWLRSQVKTWRLPEGILLIDVRPGRHVVPSELGSVQAHWVALPSATPAAALNRVLRACGADEVRRWFPHVDVPLPPLSMAALRDVGGYDEKLPAGEEWALRWRLAGASGRGLPCTQGIRLFEPAPRKSALWQAQLYVCALVTGGEEHFATRRGRNALLWRLWRAVERWSAGQWKTAWREISRAGRR